MTQPYFELTRLIERLHRRFLDLLRAELDRLDIIDVTPVQVLMLSNIGTESINVRNLMDRGYYLGSNASYNVKKLVEAGYLEQERSPHDRRATMLKVSPKGLELTARIAVLEARHAENLGAPDQGASLREAIATLKRMERSWDEFIANRE